MADYDMKVRTGHTKPIGFTVKRDGAALDVSGTTVRVARGKIKGKSLSKFERNPTFNTDGTDGKIVLTPATGDFDTKGTYEVEIKLTWSDGAEFVPEPFTILVEEAFPATS